VHVAVLRSLYSSCNADGSRSKPIDADIYSVANISTMAIASVRHDGTPSVDDTGVQMRPILDQAPTLIAVAVGALLSYVVAAASERARWRREHSARWDTARMEAYFAYAHALKVSVHVAIRIGVGRGLGTIAPALTAAEGPPRLAELEAERGALWEKVLLLGDARTIEAGREWHERYWQLSWFADGTVSGPEIWYETVVNAERARHNFYECARRSLDVTDRNLPISGWTRRHEVLTELVNLEREKHPA
jgi:hypothetical protein